MSDYYTCQDDNIFKDIDSFRSATIFIKIKDDEIRNHMEEIFQKIGHWTKIFKAEKFENERDKNTILFLKFLPGSFNSY